MAKILIISNIGTAERPFISEMEQQNPIPEKILSYQFACDTKELRKIALSVGVTPVKKDDSGDDFWAYEIKDFPKLLYGVQKNILGDGREHINKVNTELNEFEIRFPSGSTVKFVGESKPDNNTDLSSDATVSDPGDLKDESKKNGLTPESTSDIVEDTEPDNNHDDVV